MSLSLYEITIPVMIAGLGNMSNFLDGPAHMRTRKASRTSSFSKHVWRTT